MKAKEFLSLLENQQLNNDFYIEDITIEDDLEFSDIKFGTNFSYNFNNIIFLGVVNFKSIELEAQLKFYSCQFKKDFIFWNVYSKEIGNMYNIEIVNCNLCSLKISNLTNIFGLSIVNCIRISYLILLLVKLLVIFTFLIMKILKESIFYQLKK